MYSDSQPIEAAGPAGQGSSRGRNGGTKNVALIIVHGIGEQSEGDASGKLRRGLERAAAEGGQGIWFADSADVAAFTFGSQRVTVRVYEANWSRVLSEVDYGAFEVDLLTDVVWFPWVDHRLGRGSRRRLGMFLLAKTVVLSLLAGLVELGHWGISTLVRRISTLVRLKERVRWLFGAQMRDDRFREIDWENPTYENLVQAGLVPPRTFVARILDQYLGDIFAYTTSAAALIADPDTPEAQPAGRILKCLDDAIESALSHPGGCDEVHILSHSLGTVISYHYLMAIDRGGDGSAEVLGPVTALHTIGSPLEKIRYFWPPLARQDRKEGQRADSIEWYNFNNPFDVVGNRLGHFGSLGRVRNITIYQGGVVRAHTLYEHNARFLGHLTERLLGERARPKRTIKRLFLGVVAAFLEAAVALMAFGTLLVLGLAVFVLVFLSGIAFVWLYAGLLRLLGWEVLGQEIVRYALWLTLAMWAAVIVLRKFVAEPRQAAARYQRIFT